MLAFRINGAKIDIFLYICPTKTSKLLGTIYFKLVWHIVFEIPTHLFCPSLRGAKRRGNLISRHCEERSDVAISKQMLGMTIFLGMPL